MRKLITAITCLSIATIGYCQESTHTSGGNASSASGTVSYSVGQTVYTYKSDAGGSMSEGVQQVYIIEEDTTSDGLYANWDVQISIYPNPTTNNITLETGDNLSQFNYVLFDSKGAKVLSGKTNQQKTEIDILNQPAANYTLKVIADDQKIKTFNIIKNK